MLLKDCSSLRTIPGFKAILKAVITSQIQTLVEQLHTDIGEESLILTASAADGSMCFLGSGTGQGFLEGREEIKSQFLTHCLKGSSRKQDLQDLQPNQLCHRNIQVIPTHGVQGLKTNQLEKFNHHTTNLVQHNSIGKVLSIQSNGAQFPVTISNLEPHPVAVKNGVDSSETFCTISQLGNISTVGANEQNAVPVVSMQTVFVNTVSGDSPSQVLVSTDAPTSGLIDLDKQVLVDLKDKTKKTLSSKIDEITERIRKDEPQKGLEEELQADYRTASAVESKVKCANSKMESSKPRQRKSGKTKDKSRASHRKPKMPRYNIGAASDEEEGNQAVADTTDDILDLAVSSMEDSDSSFAHISLDELRDGVILKENETDIPLVDYVCSAVDDSSKHIEDSVFNLKPPDGSESSVFNLKPPDGSDCPQQAESTDVTQVTVKMTKDKSAPLQFKTITEKSLINKDLWLKCGLCSERFPNQGMLQQHVQTHSQKKYICDLCGWKFQQLRDKDRHRRIHTGEKPFICDVCNKAFARKDNLKSHKRKHICHKMGSSNFAGILTSSA